MAMGYEFVYYQNAITRPCLGFLLCLPAVIASVRGDVVPYAHLNGSQLPPAHTHAAPLSAELSSMLPSLLSEHTFVGLIKVLLYQT